MKNTTEVIQEVMSTGGIKMWFNSKEPYMETSLYRATLLNPFQFNGKAIDAFHFYNEEGIVYSHNYGWLTNGFGNNPYETMSFEDEINVRRKVNFSRDEVFVVLADKSNVWGDKAYHLYVPMSYLESLGYTVIKTTQEYDYQTHTSTDLYVGGERTKNNCLFTISLESSRVEHFDKLKAKVLAELAECTDRDQMADVVRKHLPVN